MELVVIILAAGKGTRMGSQRPKVLHQVGGKSLLGHVLDVAHKLSQHIYVVYGAFGEQIQQHFKDQTCLWIKQEQQLGTGHAVLQVLPFLKDEQRVLILYGDVPLITESTLKQFLGQTPAEALGILTVLAQNPTGLGRIIRNNEGIIQAIVEERDATPQQKSIKEVNSGFLTLPVHLLRHLSEIGNNNQQSEYYLTDLVGILKNKHHLVTTSSCEEAEVLGVNTKHQLAQVERLYQLRQAESLMQQGATLYDPNRFDCRGTVTIGQDVEIDVGVVFEGHVAIGDNTKIGPYCTIKDSVIANNVEIYSHSILEQATISSGCQIGPFARLRPGAIVQEKAKVGNFVEIKNATLQTGAKVNHLSYIGDATIGDSANIGAGTITCNYDGTKKYQTIVGNYAFIGSNTALIAPVNIGAGATIGAGSVISKDVPEKTLAITRSPQKTIVDWQRGDKLKPRDQE